MKLTAVIIDDEFKIRTLFAQLLKTHCPEIEILGEAANIIEGYDLIMSKNPTTVFLDIEMPGGNGFELLAKFKKVPFETIFVSSYGHYAIKAVRLSALDYLLKPVIVEELVKIPQRVRGALEKKESITKYELLLENLKKTDQSKKIAIQHKNKLELIYLSDIVYLKADGNYTWIFLQNGERVFVPKTLKEYEDILCENDDSSFIRVHRAHIVNISHINRIEKGEESTIILQDKTTLEISRRKKIAVIDKFNSLQTISQKK
jgi:two-component system, LytTR family, response regulator